MGLYQHILKELSADAILDHTRTLWENNRSSNFTEYQKSADYVMNLCKEYGLEVENIDYGADGRTQYGDAVMPLGWNCTAGKIELIHPTHKILGDRETEPNCIGMWSPATPEGGLEAEVVCLPSGEPGELNSRDPKDKIILTPGKFETIREAAIKKGALAVVSSWHPDPNAKDSLQWINRNTETPGGWGPKKEEITIPALAITPQQGEDLKRMAESDPLRMRITIKAAMEASSFYTVHSVLHGDPGEAEVLILVPLYDQGAHFNAVGVAVALESARVLNDLIKADTFPRPQRSIRFLFVPKRYGALAFAHHYKALLDKTIFALFLESGAGDPDLSWCRWGYHLAPVCQRHYTDGLAWFLCTEYLKTWRPQRFIEQRPFSMVGDVFFNDPAIGVPTHWLYGGTPDECRHTSADRIDTVDRRACIDLCAASASILYTLASVGVPNIPHIAYWNYQLSLERIQNDIRYFMDRSEEVKTINEINDLLGEITRHFPRRIESEIQGLTTLETIDTEVTTSPEWPTIQEFIAILRDQQKASISLLRRHLETKTDLLGVPVTSLNVPKAPVEDERIPRRIGDTIGTITLDALPYASWTTPVKTSPRGNVPFIMAWWLADGKRTVGEIEALLKLDIERYRECIPAWFTFLEKHGYIQFGPESETETVPAVEEKAPEVTPAASPEEATPAPIPAEQTAEPEVKEESGTVENDKVW
jgi:hypothetical protein